MLWQGQSVLPETYSLILVNNVNKVIITMISLLRASIGNNLPMVSERQPLFPSYMLYCNTFVMKYIMCVYIRK